MKNNKKGFTLIELLVMVALISIVSATIFYNYNVSDSYFSLERSAQGIGQEIRIAQQKALAGIAYTSNGNGYGLYFDINLKDQYNIYENRDEDPRYNFSEDGVVKVLSFPEDVRIENLMRNGFPVDNLSISFFPPGPITYIGDAASDSIGEIVLRVTDRNDIKKVIKINSVGSFEIYQP